MTTTEKARTLTVMNSNTRSSMLLMCPEMCVQNHIGPGKSRHAERRPMINPTAPTAVPFTSDDYSARMSRVITAAGAAGLDGVLLTPGPDLVWLTGYRPTAGDHRGWIWRAVHPPDRSRHRRHHPRTAVHDRGPAADGGGRGVFFR